MNIVDFSYCSKIQNYSNDSINYFASVSIIGDLISVYFFFSASQSPSIRL